MNLYSEANKYFEEILKEENAKLNESLKKKKLKESIGSRKKLRETAIEDPYYLALDTTNPYYKVLLGILKNNKKIANSVWEEYIKDYLPDEGTDSPEEFKQNLLDSFFYDIVEEMVEEGDDDLARKVIDILGWKKHFSGYEYGLYDDTIPSVWYSVYELDKDGNELDEVDSFDTPEEAIAFAKKQSFPTHVVFVPEADPDDDPEYRRYLRDHYDYEPFEVVWESVVDESFKYGRSGKKRLKEAKHYNIDDLHFIYTVRALDEDGEVEDSIRSFKNKEDAIKWAKTRNYFVDVCSDVEEELSYDDFLELENSGKIYDVVWTNYESLSDVLKRTTPKNQAELLSYIEQNLKDSGDYYDDHGSAKDIAYYEFVEGRGIDIIIPDAYVLSEEGDPDNVSDDIVDDYFDELWDNRLKKKIEDLLKKYSRK